MDKPSYDKMAWCVNFLKDEMDKPMDILEIGSMDINGTYNDLFNRWNRTGIDVCEGKNVDIVTKDPYHYPFKDASFDMVISGQCLEHVEDMYAWADEAIRVLKPNGLMIILAPWNFPIHMDSTSGYPGSTDCWRILPDGMRWLFVKRGKLKPALIQTFNYQINMGVCYGVFRKI